MPVMGRCPAKIDLLASLPQAALHGACGSELPKPQRASRRWGCWCRTTACPRPCCRRPAGRQHGRCRRQRARGRVHRRPAQFLQVRHLRSLEGVAVGASQLWSLDSQGVQMREDGHADVFVLGLEPRLEGRGLLNVPPHPSPPSWESWAARCGGPGRR